MSFLRRPRYRFVLWAVVLVAVAAATAIAGLDWWLIVLVVFGVWLVLTIVERRIDRAASRPRPVREPSAPAPEATAAPVETNAETAAPARRRRLLAPRPAASQPAPAAPAVPAGVRQWCNWTLDRVARETTDAELRFLVLSLQEYADADGMLPLQFDPLVRESFGELLGSTG